MASQNDSTSHDLSDMTTYKPSALFRKLLSRSSNKPLYNSRLLCQEYEPDPNWRMPEIPASEIYDLPLFQFRATTLIRYCSVNVPISLGQTKYQIPLIQQADIDWGLEHGYEYIHIGLIQFGINPLVRPGLDTSALLCIIDSRHNSFQDAMISGFQAPLHNGPVWSSALPRYQVSLRDPYINTLLQAYIQFVGFDMDAGSKIAQLHSSICLRFVTSTMPPLNPKLLKRATSESVVVGPGNVSPLSLGFCQLTEIDEWSVEYEPLSESHPMPMPKEMTVYMNAQGQPVLKLGRTQSQRLPTLERQFSHLSASSSRSDPERSTRVNTSKHPVYKPIPGRSKFDDHLLNHQKSSSDCYYYKKKYPVPDPSLGDDMSPTPSLPTNFRTYQSKVEHQGQHSDCSECQSLAVPTIKMMDSTLPRSGRDKRTELPQRSLGTGNHVPKFQNDLVADLGTESLMNLLLKK